MILFAHGEDAYQVRDKANQVIGKAVAQGMPEDAVVRIDAAEATLPDYQQALAGGSLFSARQVVVIRNLLSAPADLTENVLPLLKTVPEDTIVMVAELGKPDRRKSAFKALQALASKEWEFPLLNETAAVRWLGAVARDRGVSLGPGAAQALVSRAGTDGWTLSTELDKLAHAGAGPVTARQVHDLVTADLTGDVFELVDSLGRRDAARALTAWSGLMAAGEPPLRVLAMIVRQYRILLAVRHLSDTGASEAAIARELAKPPRVVGALPPFVIRKAKQQAALFTERELRESFDALADLDWQIKTGSREPEAAIELFIAEACQREPARR